MNPTYRKDVIKKHIKGATCPKCRSDHTTTDYEYGNKKCFDCGNLWDTNEQTQR